MRIIKKLAISALLMIVSCTISEYSTSVIVTYKFINASGVDITIQGGCGFDENQIDDANTYLKITSGDSAIVMQSKREVDGRNPSIENLILFPGSCFTVYGDSVKCEYGAFTGIRDIANYETAEETKKNQFLFVYRFTPENMAEASECQ